jgi:L-seryl-tRNA(Ser) seleniumtransferase
VSFSGDKLLGGPQAGLIVGRIAIVNRLRKHPLYRALRVDKLALAALEATLNAHRRGSLFTEIPTLQMLAANNSDLKERAQQFVNAFARTQHSSALSLSLIDGESAIGGGSGPNTHPSTTLIALEHAKLTADEIECRLRYFKPAVISRVAEGKVLLDLRTVAVSEETELAQALAHLSN